MMLREFLQCFVDLSQFALIMYLGFNMWRRQISS